MKLPQKISRGLTQMKRGSELLEISDPRFIRVHSRLKFLLQFLLAVRRAQAHLVSEKIQQ